MSTYTSGNSPLRNIRHQGRVNLGRETGVAMFMSLLILVILTILALTGLRTSIIEDQISGNHRQAANALFAAEQGVSQAITDLFDGTIVPDNADSTWTATGSVSGSAHSVSYTVRHRLVGGNLLESDDGRSYYIIDSDGEALVAPSTANERQVARRMLEVGLALEFGAASNVAGFIGCQGVTGGSNFVTGSYSSSGQPTDNDRGDVATTDSGAFLYLDASSDFDIVGEVRSTGALYMGGDAIVRRDALANTKITTQSNAHIYGSATTNGSFSGSNSSVSGDINQGATVVPVPVVPLASCDPFDIDTIFSAANGIKTSNNNSDIGICAGTCSYYGSPAVLGTTGSSKDYYFRDFVLEGEETVLIRGSVRLYIGRDFTMKSNPQMILDANADVKIYMEAGNFWMDSEAKMNHDPVNFFPACDPGGCPRNVWVYSKKVDTVKDDKNWQDHTPDIWDDSQDVAGVKIDSNSIFFGLIYAPRSHVVLYSNAQIYGFVRGRYVTADSNLNFNYDEDLDDLYTGSPTDYNLVYWEEEYPD